MATPSRRTRASRDRYRDFVGDYHAGRLDAQTTERIAGRSSSPTSEPSPGAGTGTGTGTATRT